MDKINNKIKIQYQKIIEALAPLNKEEQLALLLKIINDLKTRA
jgi:hypothetical protein